MEKSIAIMRDKQVNFMLLIASGVLIIWKPELLSYIIGLYLIIAGTLNLALLYQSSRKKSPAKRRARKKKQLFSKQFNQEDSYQINPGRYLVAVIRLTQNLRNLMAFSISCDSTTTNVSSWQLMNSAMFTFFSKNSPARQATAPGVLSIPLLVIVKRESLFFFLSS